MVLSGHGFSFFDKHIAGEIRRTDYVGADKFNQARQNFQADTRGNVYLRIYTINTETDLIRVQAYSPILDTYLLDGENNFYFNLINIPNTVSEVTMSGVTLF
jgi:hypothetical protein